VSARRGAPGERISRRGGRQRPPRCNPASPTDDTVPRPTGKPTRSR
jgi:hypothetical protein